VRIELRPKERSLLIEWSDGVSIDLSHRVLRMKCRCAGCVYVRRSGRSISAPAEIELLEVVPYGPNAVQLRFSDGHERGIFPFPYLRELEGSAPSV
jgi:DUF971 family protein